MAGLRVGQAFGMFLLPGFGVSSSSPAFLGTRPPCVTQALTAVVPRMLNKKETLIPGQFLHLSNSS